MEKKVMVFPLARIVIGYFTFLDSAQTANVEK